MKRLLLMVLVIVLALFAAYFYWFHIGGVERPALSAEVSEAVITSSGLPRSFEFYIPQRYQDETSAGERGLPLVFVLHGSMSVGADMRRMTAYGFEQLADRDGFIVVYPNGYDRHWNDCRASASYKANTENIDDIQFVRDMIAYFAERYPVDELRVFATGLSNGGHMAYRLGLEMPERFRAIAPMAANLPIDDNLDCEKRGQPISIAIFNGTEDPVNPYAGGLVEIMGDSSRGEVRSAEETAYYWRSLAMFDEQPRLTEFPEQDDDASTSIAMARWQSNAGYEVRLYTLHGSGHVVPSKKIRFGKFLGGSAGDLEASEEIWRFFQGVAAWPVMSSEPVAPSDVLQQPHAPAGSEKSEGGSASVTECMEPRPEMCTMDYRPVCAGSREGTRKTYSNGCSACSDPVIIGYSHGACEVMGLQQASP